MSTIIVHGGVNVTQDPAVYKLLKHSAKKGYERIDDNIIEAVETAIRILEDDPHFNAGYGSVLNMNGEVEMDAALMYGKTGRSGGVAALKGIKNPISVARKVLEATDCVLVAGDGAYQFAVSQGIQTSRRIFEGQRESWVHAQKVSGTIREVFDLFTGKHIDITSDTVGCIAVNDRGELAAGTSTGGAFYKIPGRVGDSPVPGAGLYASKRCSVSCSGEGEAFLELSLAKMVDMWAEKIEDPEILSQKAITLLDQKHKRGGIIVLMKNGSYAVAHNCNSFPVVGYGVEGYFSF